MCFKNRAGFTFIEILMTLAVVGILFVPVMQLFSSSLYATNQNQEMITAMNLAQSEIEKTINLNLTKTQLQEHGTEIIPPENEKPLELNKSFWRTKREIIAGTDPLEVRVLVYKEGNPDEPLVTLVTLIEDMMWDSVKPVST